MVLEDIGEILFVQILQMDATVLTGNIINDLVMFFFLPSVIILIVVYIISSRLLGRGSRLSFLLAVALYLFIIFGGFYPAFAYLAGPYFIFLIFIFGAILFLQMHFRPSRAGSGNERTGDLSGGGLGRYENMSRQALLVERDRIKSEIGTIGHELDESRKTGDAGRVEDLRKRRSELTTELHEVETNLDVMKKWRRRVG